MNALLISHASFGASLAGAAPTVSSAGNHGGVRSGAVRSGAVRSTSMRAPAAQSDEARFGAESSGEMGRSSLNVLAGAGLSLTRRGRLVFFGIPAIAAAALILFVSFAIMAGSFASPANAASEVKAVNMADYAVAVTVLQGDSLWSIAGAADPTRDVRHVVREIIALNELGTGVLQAGQRLYVPIPK
ncbi:LysM peptidoglycan-binding domain-containing protein [Arthrobacter sp. Sr24]